MPVMDGITASKKIMEIINSNQWQHAIYNSGPDKDGDKVEEE